MERYKSTGAIPKTDSRKGQQPTPAYHGGEHPMAARSALVDEALSMVDLEDWVESASVSLDLALHGARQGFRLTRRELNGDVQLQEHCIGTVLFIFLPS